ncbi:putative chromosome segregation protein [Lyophyllum shimeji]|uniref:Chromosome segregation protein n=1 Tax=Lyophyllum shimeji TaxID=47721 RepID=A0A9P3PFZ1_LYOSH|nr:putative chromosome segregation protein [Lyophyllum shimeji]
MSDDGDEFGGLAPTTPAVRVKKSAPSRATRLNSRSEAGPSSKPKRAPKNVPVPASDHSEVEETDPFDFTKHVDDEEEDDEHPATPPTARPTRKDQAARAEAPVVNGKQTAKVKGKAKAAPQKSSQKRRAPEPMDVDPIEVVDEGDEDQDAALELSDAINVAAGHKRPKPAGKGDQVLAEQLRRAQDQINSLKRQLEELFHVRNTEAEELLRQQETQYEAQLQAQQAVIQELIGSKELMKDPANANVLKLLIGDAADEEVRALQKEVTRWKEVANERQRAITQREEKIAELEQNVKDLRLELQTEIKRSTSLNAKLNQKQPLRSGGPVGRPGGVDDPRHAEVVRFYEDLSNLLVPNMKAQPGKYLDLEDWVLSCIYTFNDDEAADQDKAPNKSLNFTLRCCYETPAGVDPETITSKDQLIPTVHFTPLELDKEPPEFVEKLDFLSAPFSFGRNQLPLFLRTIYGRMKEAVLDEADGEDGDSVEIVEDT